MDPLVRLIVPFYRDLGWSRSPVEAYAVLKDSAKAKCKSLMQKLDAQA